MVTPNGQSNGILMGVTKERNAVTKERYEPRDGGDTMKNTARNTAIWTTAIWVTLAVIPGIGTAGAPDEVGTKEFGLTEQELVQSIELVEKRIAACMRQQGFEYVPVDYTTIRQGMNLVETMAGMSEETFVAKYGYGISTFYTGLPPQLTTGHNPARTGLGQRNVELFRNLPAADQVAYVRALVGDNVEATFAVSLEEEDFSRCGGCTRIALEQTFTAEQLDASYYNPLNALVNEDPRMKKALRKYSEQMRKRGFESVHPDDVKPDLMNRLDAITENRTIQFDALSADQRAALEELQEYERKVAWVSFKLAEDLFDPVEERILREMYSRSVN
jgi:hypothetical protein